MPWAKPALCAAAGLMAVGVTACAAPTPLGSSRPTEAATRTANVERGQELYAATCQRCHGDESGAGGIPEAPPHNADGHTWHHPDAQLIDWMLNGKPFTAMPGFGEELTRGDAEAVMAYITAWWTEDQRAEQASVSERYRDALDAQSEPP